MQGRREPSLFTKKNPAPAGEEEGRMRSAFKDSLIYLSMASLSGPDREYKRPLGGEVPGRRSMAQSYGRWGGKDVRTWPGTYWRPDKDRGTPPGLRRDQQTPPETQKTNSQKTRQHLNKKQDRTDSKITQSSPTNPREGCAAPTTGAPEQQEHPGNQGGTAQLPHSDCQRPLNLLKEWSGWWRRGEGHWGNGQRWGKGEEWQECPTAPQQKYPRNCLQLLNQQGQNRNEWCPYI